jgi:hypothetical protein
MIKRAILLSRRTAKKQLFWRSAELTRWQRQMGSTGPHFAKANGIRLHYLVAVIKRCYFTANPVSTGPFVSSTTAVAMETQVLRQALDRVSPLHRLVLHSKNPNSLIH